MHEKQDRLSIILFLLILLLQVSCKNEKEHNVNKDDIVSIKFPDTIISNTRYNGTIEYKYSDHDGYRNTIGTDTVSRYIHLYLSLDTIKKNSIEQIIATDTFLTQKTNSIDFIISSKETGERYLNGYIVDIVIFDTLNQSKESESLPASLSEVILNKKIVVKDNSQ